VINKVLVSATVASLWWTNAAQAQQADQASSVASAAPQNEMGEIVVTATKRLQSLRDVPLSITAITGSQLTERGVQSFADLARHVPGVVQSGSANYAKFAIRGIQTSTTTSSSGEQKAVAVYMDDLPLTSFSIITPEISPYDMASVEVLRGPQGTLFGSGTLAGAVRFVTNKPKADRVEASVDGDIG
jgi:iron complex outermembrane recepter protein